MAGQQLAAVGGACWGSPAGWWEGCSEQQQEEEEKEALDPLDRHLLVQLFWRMTTR